MIFQYGGIVIDCDAVDHCCIMDEEPEVFVAVSFRASPKVTRIKVQDHEHGMVMLSKLKRGMIAAATGEYDLLDPPDSEDYDDDDESTPTDNG